jgi:hypothetical protein
MYAKNTNNATIKATLKSKSFKNDKSEHKYAVLWASKFYRTINRIMRNKTFEEQVSTCPYAIKYIKHFLKYFDTHGVTAEQLLLKTNVLYRGITADYLISQEMQENGFMSTSYKKHVAKSFANKGKILSFDIKKLPKDTKFAVIDQEIEDYLMEYEVLFLPGTIRILNVSEFVECSYVMNSELVSKYSGLSGGGELEDIPEIDPSEKLVVWYRAIPKKPVQIIAQIFVPKKNALVFFKQNVLPMDDQIQRYIELIPDYNKTNSYNIYMAIYDYKKKHIDTLHYGLFDSFFTNMFDQTRIKEVESTITEKYSWAT